MNKRHFWMLVLLLITLPMVAAIFQNTFTTDPTGKTATLLTTTTADLVPLSHRADDSTGLILQSGAVIYQNTTNATFKGVVTITNVNNGAAAHTIGVTAGGIITTNDPTAGGTSSPTNTPIVLTLTTTNVSGGDWSLGSASGTTFKLILTTNAFFGDAAFSNVPTTNGQQNAVLYIIQDGTGARTVTWTNNTFGFPNGVPSVQTTNAGAVDVYSLVNSLSTNGNIWVIQANNLHR